VSAKPVKPAAFTPAPKGYAAWIAEVKVRVRAAQLRASLAVNHELIALYWSIGRDLLERRAKSKWGDGVIARASADLRAEFPDMQGSSASNLRYLRQLAQAWHDHTATHQQPVGELPCGTTLVLLPSIARIEAELANATRTTVEDSSGSKRARTKRKRR